MFDVGRQYCRDEIYDMVGGSKQSYLPTKNGKVVAACVTRKMNPQAPWQILCGRGPIVESAGALLARQPGPIPVFLKQDVNRWEYLGMFKVVDSFTSGPEFNGCVLSSGRLASEISLALILAKTPGTCCHTC